MFHFISWQLFLTALALLIVAYYLITSPLLFYKEILQRFKSTPNASANPPVEKQSNQQLHASLMGTANETPIQSQPTVASEPSPEDFITTGSDEDEDFISVKPLPNHILIGSVADLLEEVKKLVLLIAADKTNKTESKTLFTALFIRYPHLQATSYPLAISLYICEAAMEHFAFELTSAEVLSWWEPAADSSIQE